MTDIALTVPCPGCKMPADSSCVDLDTGAPVDGVHSNRLYRAYVVAEAMASNRAAELAAEVERLRGVVRDLLDAWEVGTAPADVMARARALFATRGGAS